MTTPDARPGNGRPSIVATGTGLTTSLGIGVAENWRRLMAGESGFAPIDAFPVDDATVHDGGTAPPLEDDPRSTDYADGRARQRAYVERTTSGSRSRLVRWLSLRRLATGRDRLI